MSNLRNVLAVPPPSDSNLYSDREVELPYVLSRSRVTKRPFSERSFSCLRRVIPLLIPPL